MGGSNESIFLLGTGYIGGTILSRLLVHPIYKKYTINVLTRREDQFERLKELGVCPVFGDLSSYDVIKAETLRSDIVIHTASSDDLPSVKAILDGITSRPSPSSPHVYIHTSGTGELCTFDEGESSNYIYDDSKPGEMDRRIKDDAWHRREDLEIKRFVQSGKGGNSRIQIVLPPTIYGKGEGPFNNISQQIPTLVELAIKEGYSGYYGKGEAYWNNISIQSLADAYILILTNLLSSDPSLSSLYYFAETGEHQWKTLASSVATSLFKRGKISLEGTRSWSQEVLDRGGKSFALGYGGNSRCKASRLKELGWKGVSKRNVLEDVEWEIEEILRQKGL